MNTYGRLSNASLVRMYGFAEHNNPNDMVSDCILIIIACYAYFYCRHMFQ